MGGWYSVCESEQDYMDIRRLHPCQKDIGMCLVLCWESSEICSSMFRLFFNKLCELLGRIIKLSCN